MRECAWQLCSATSARQFGSGSNVKSWEKGGIMTRLEAKQRVQLRSILFATDFSDNSLQAVQYAMAIARHYESKIVVAHVLVSDTYQVISQEPTVLTDWFRREAEEQMTDLLVSGVLRDIPHEVVMKQGSIWPALSEVVKEKEIDLIVVGTHGRTGIGKMMLGSTAEEVFRHADCPVLTVGPRVSDNPPQEANFRRIVYATDATMAPDDAAAYALSLSQEYVARLTVIHAIRETPGIWSDTHEQVQKDYLYGLRQLVPAEVESWCDPEFVVRFGDPAAEILDVANGRKADVIVLGVHGDMVLAGHRPATVAYKVVCEAHCPVLTVKGEANA